MVGACLGVLNNGTLLVLLMELILLLFRKEGPEGATNFHPISLCNVVYKLVMKTIANHLKLVLSNLISINQRAFVLRRVITDSVIATFELLHFWKRKNKKDNERKGFMP